MKTRAIKNGTIVWFGSAGIDKDGNKIAAENFSEKAQHVVDSLKQKLSVIKSELWYDVNFGVPIFDKLKSKALIDSYVISVINSEADVKSISSFVSQITNREYSCNAKIMTIFGETQFSM